MIVTCDNLTDTNYAAIGMSSFLLLGISVLNMFETFLNL